MAMPAPVGVSSQLLPPPASLACRDSAQHHAELVEEDRVAANVDQRVDSAGDMAMGKTKDGLFLPGGPYACKSCPDTPAPPPLTVVAVFARDVAPERRAYLTIVLKPIVLVLLLMWVSLPV